MDEECECSVRPGVPCRALVPSGLLRENHIVWTCSRLWGHPGPHIACGTLGCRVCHRVYVWPDLKPIITKLMSYERGIHVVWPIEFVEKI